MPAGVRVADDHVPAVDRNLAGDDDRSCLVAILDDLQEIAALLGVERLRSPVVEDEQVEAGERAQHASVAAVGAGERQGGEQPRPAVIVDGEILPAEGPRPPAFAAPPAPLSPEARRAWEERVSTGTPLCPPLTSTT